MKIQSFVFSPFQENTYVLFDDTKECAIIDPGCFDRTEKKALADFITENDLKVTQLWNTHCHLDHVCGNHFVAETYGVSPKMHKLDLPTLAMFDATCHTYGIHGAETPPDEVKLISEGEKVTFGNQSFDILFAPGHAPGHVVFYHKEQGVVFSGDVLFRGSIGRTDLPGGDHNTLLDAIRNTMFSLPDETVVYSGHGPETSIGFEKENNPFFQ